MGNAYLPNQQASTNSDGHSLLKLVPTQPAPGIKESTSSACYSVGIALSNSNIDRISSGTGPRTCINLKQTCVSERCPPRRPSTTRIAQRTCIPQSTDSSRRRPSLLGHANSFKPNGLSLRNNRTSHFSAAAANASSTQPPSSLSQKVACHSARDVVDAAATGPRDGSVDDASHQDMLPLTESALRVVSGRISDLESAQSVSRFGVKASSAQFGAFVEADELLRLKHEAQLLVVRPDVDAHTSLSVSSGNSNAGSISMRGAVGGDAATSIIRRRGSQDLYKSSGDHGRRPHHPGVRRSLLSTLKQPKKRSPNTTSTATAATRGGIQGQSTLHRHMIKIDRLRQSLEHARHCGQLTDVSCELLHEVLQQCSTNAENLLLSQDWRQFLISPAAAKAEASTSASSSPTDSPSSQGQYASLARDTGSGSISLSEKEKWLMDSPLDLEHIVVDLDDASDVSDMSDYRPSFGASTQPLRVNTFDSDSLWQQDAERRFLDYRRSHLRGRKLGLSCRSPFDAVQEVDHNPRVEVERRRELKPLRISREFKDPDSGAVWANVVRDLNMPGFVEDFLKQLSRTGQQQDNVRNQAVLLQLLTHLAAERQSSAAPSAQVVKSRRSVSEVAQRHEAIWWDHDMLSVEERQLSNLVYGDHCLMPECTPGISRARRSDARELYRRLVRALDQRVPPQERLLATPSSSMGGYRAPVGKPRAGGAMNGGGGRRGRQRPRPGEQRDSAAAAASSFRWAPSWIRASRSRQLFGKGSNLFADARYRTRLADLDPERPVSTAY